jgi:subtilisin family serine protease
LITVGAITRDNEVWSRSCAGPLVEVLAPGANVLLASGTGIDHFIQPAFGSGTSFATPYVAGMAARILEREPDLTPAEVEARLKSSSSLVNGLPVPVMTPMFRRRAVR